MGDVFFYPWTFSNQVEGVMIKVMSALLSMPSAGTGTVTSPSNVFGGNISPSV